MCCLTIVHANCADLEPDLRVVCLPPLGWRPTSVLFVHALVALWRRDRFIVLHGPAASLWRLTRSEQGTQRHI